MIASLLSGGKDSTLATYWAFQQGWEVMAVTFLPRRDYSYMLQRVNARWAHLVAEAMGVPHVYVEVSGEKEGEIEEMASALEKLGAEGIVAGAIASEYQRERVDYIGNKLGVPSYAPLWHKGPHVLFEYREMKAIYVRVAAEGLGRELLGRPFKPLPGEERGNSYYHPLLEGGEGETFVVDAPFFRCPIEVEGRVEWRGQEGDFVIEKAFLRCHSSRRERP